ncbi:uncharacterized protein BP5553_10085 [Venustampulla echinocandica]|uniref:Uncharacterized protein n=1 Tax=Venustampulla echinocandica TaxID=2656787 RepID=A0A370TAD0_9HELO|nr:uncharacterized protein BP5553_10085 [Venustampulla echinocandica]RDL30740.1 hypothetical protein BP5553_10085 [Venustampulla echinocandica]
MADDQAKNDRAAVTANLNDQKTLAQLSSSGKAAQDARPSAMARHAKRKQAEDQARAQAEAQAREAGGSKDSGGGKGGQGQ